MWYCQLIQEFRVYNTAGTRFLEKDVTEISARMETAQSKIQAPQDSNNLPALAQQLEEDSDNIMSWFTNNFLKAYTSKTKSAKAEFAALKKTAEAREQRAGETNMEEDLANAQMAVEVLQKFDQDFIAKEHRSTKFLQEWVRIY